MLRRAQLALVFLVAPIIATAAEPKLELVVQLGHFRSVDAVAVSGDGKRVVSGSADKSAIVMDVKSGQILRRLAGHLGGITAVAINGDGSRVLTASEDEVAILWDVLSGTPVQKFKGQHYRVGAVALSENGERVLTAAYDKTAMIWDVASGRRLHTLSCDGAVMLAALSRDGKRVLTCMNTGAPVLWDAETGKKLHTLEGDGQNCALSHDRKRAVTVSKDGKIRVFDVDSGKLLNTFKTDPRKQASSLRGYGGIAFRPDGKRLLLADGDSLATIWDLDEGYRADTFRSPDGGIVSAAFSADGKRVFFGTSEGAVGIWEPMAQPTTMMLQGRSRRIWSVDLSADGRRVLAGTETGATLWDADEREKVKQFQGHCIDEPSAHLSDDGKRLLLKDWRPISRLFDVDSGKTLHVFSKEDEGFYSLSADGKRVAIGAALGGDTILFDGDTGAVARTIKVGFLTKHTSLSSDGKQVVIIDQVGLSIVNAETGERIKTIAAISGRDATFIARAGDRLFTYKFPGEPIVWDLTTGKKLSTVTETELGVVTLGLSRNGKAAAIGLWDGSARTVDPETGNVLQVFRGHIGNVAAVAPSSDGKRLLTGGEDGTLRLWDAVTGRELCCLYRLDGDNWLATTPEGHFDGTEDARKLVSFRLAGTLRFAPADRVRQFYRPRLVNAVLQGKPVNP